MPRHPAAAALAMGIHDLAQPLSAAALSIETASLLLSRDRLEACQERIQATTDEIERANRLLRVLRLAHGAEPSPRQSEFDPVEVLSAVWPDLHLPTPGSFRGDRNYLEAALTGLSLVFTPDAGQAAIRDASRDGAFRIRITGRAGNAPLVAFWIRSLRKAGVKANLRWLHGGPAMTLTLAQEASKRDRRQAEAPSQRDEGQAARIQHGPGAARRPG